MILIKLQLHMAPVLDVDWRTDTSFASCSTDKIIYVCKVRRSYIPLLYLIVFPFTLENEKVWTSLGEKFLNFST